MKFSVTYLKILQKSDALNILKCKGVFEDKWGGSVSETCGCIFQGFERLKDIVNGMDPSERKWAELNVVLYKQKLRSLDNRRLSAMREAQERLRAAGSFRKVYARVHVQEWTEEMTQFLRKFNNWDGNQIYRKRRRYYWHWSSGAILLPYSGICHKTIQAGANGPKGSTLEVAKETKLLKYISKQRIDCKEAAKQTPKTTNRIEVILHVLH